VEPLGEKAKEKGKRKILLIYGKVSATADNYVFENYLLILILQVYRNRSCKAYIIAHELFPSFFPP
jgi:hypothetical protein